MLVTNPNSITIEYARALNGGDWLLLAIVALAELCGLWIGLRGVWRAWTIGSVLAPSGRRGAIRAWGAAVYLAIATAAIVGVGFLVNELGFRFVEARVEADRVVLRNYCGMTIASLRRSDVAKVEVTKDNRINEYCTITTLDGTRYSSVRFKDASLVDRLRRVLSEPRGQSM